MPQSSWPVLAVIAVVGGIFAMAIPGAESRTFEHIRHRPNKSINNMNNVIPTSSTVRCTAGKRRIELDRSVGRKHPDGFSICEWNSADISREKSSDSSEQFQVKLQSRQVPIVLPEVKYKRGNRNDRSLSQDIVDTLDGQTLHESTKSEGHLNLQNEKDNIVVVEEESSQSYHASNSSEEEIIRYSTNPSIDKINKNNSHNDINIDHMNNLTNNNSNNDEADKNSTAKSNNMSLLLPNVKSERLVSPTSTPGFTIENLTEAIVESPFIVSNETKPPDNVLTSYKEKSRVGIAVETRSHLKKDHSKASINLVEGQPNKVFYEIKPSLNTAMRADDNDEDSSTRVPLMATTKRHFLGFKLPSMPSSFGKFGPYFLDEVDFHNVTERIGSAVQLDCRIGLLGDKKVTWFQPNKDSIRLLTVGSVQYSADERISLKFQYPDNWRLQIAYATLRDTGMYKCQVEIDPANFMVKTYHVLITAPTLNITDDSGRAISGERHLKAGSTLRLRCEGRDVLEKLNESLLWARGDEILTMDVSENRTSELVGEKEMPVIVSTLVVEKASPRHAGNYSCIVPDRAKTTIAVHVLNGELPAAVHHGNGVSSAVLNLWLIHLTISYGFFR